MPGCSAEKSNNVQIGDEIVAVDGTESLTVPEAKQLMLGRWDNYSARPHSRTHMHTPNIVAVDGTESLTVPDAKQLMLGRWDSQSLQTLV